MSADPAPVLLNRQPSPADLSGISVYWPPEEGAPERYRALDLYGSVDWLSALER